MVRVVDCHAGVLGSNPGGPRYFPLGITTILCNLFVLREYVLMLMISTTETNFDFYVIKTRLSIK